MILICSKCGGSHFHKKGIVNGVQQYKCVSNVNGSTCNCRKQPIFLNDDEETEFEDIKKENTKLAKKNQRIQDINRIERKSFRENTRLENAVIEYVQELRTTIQENPMTINFDNIKEVGYSGESVGIVHLSDLHFNELVDVVGNNYDFKVASKRLKLFAKKIVSGFQSRNIRDVFIVFTGDLLNSDRRVDELLSMATNRAMATFLAVKILSQFVVEIAQKYNVQVLSVTGNESRIRDDYTQLDSMATDNFDFMIYEMMKLYLGNIEPRVKFISGNTFEYILSVNGTNILVVHGHRLGKMNNNDLSKAISKWAKKGIIVNFVMCGHIHETNITDTLLRSASLVGNNAYADAGLNLYSRASQNYYIIDSEGNLDATKVDLQNITKDMDMYDINSDLEAYNTKSINKLKDTTNILTIVV